MNNPDRYAGRKPKGKPPSYPDPFECVKCYVPKSLMRKLRVESDRLGVPVERLLVRAGDEVMRSEYESFNVNLALPDPGSSTIEEQQALYQFLARADKGVDLDLLFLAYVEIGFTYDSSVRDAVADLIARGLVELFNKGDYAIPKVRVINKERLARKERFLLFAGEKVDQDRRKLFKKKLTVSMECSGELKKKGVL